jgi:hypothetical protein
MAFKNGHKLGFQPALCSVAGQQSAAISFVAQSFPAHRSRVYVLLFLMVAVLVQLFTPIPLLAWLAALTRMVLFCRYFKELDA